MDTLTNTVRTRKAPLFRVGDTAPYALALASVAAFSFLSGGYVIARSTPVAVILLCALAVCVWLVRTQDKPPRLFLAALAVFAAFAAWTGVSTLWSFGPDLTWVAFNLTAFYLAVVAVLGLTPAGGLQLRTVAYGFVAVAAAVGVYAFLGKALPDVVTHAHTYARLDSPVGYWNVLALMMVMGLCVALSVAGDRATGAAARTAAAAAAVPMCFTFFFTFSRGGWVVLAVTLVLYFAFTTTRLASLASFSAVVVPVAFVLWRLRGLDTLFAEMTDAALRTQQGGALLRWAIAALFVTAGVQLAAALVQRAVRWPRWSTVGAGAVVLTAVLAVTVGGGARYVQAHGGISWVEDQFHTLITDADTGGGGGAGRLTVLTTNGRVALWREAWDQAGHNAAVGTGAGTFPFTHYRFRTTLGVVKHAHSQWFNVLSELGVVGLVLFAGAMALLVAAAVGNPFRRRQDPLHPVLVALQAGVIAFGVHMSADWHWDMAAIGTPVFVFVAACVSYRAGQAVKERRAAAEERRAAAEESPAEAFAAAPGDAPRLRSRGASWAPRALASVALILLAASWLPPYLSQRAENAALDAAASGDVSAAIEHARRAASLNPLAVSPLLSEASLLQQLGRNREALERLQAAAELQPENYEVWYQLGMLLHGAMGRDEEAREAFARALGLNPLDRASRLEYERLARRP